MHVAIGTSSISQLWPWISSHWAAVAIVSTLVGLALFVVLTVAKYVRICLNIFSDAHSPLSAGPADYQRLVGEVVRFRSFDGTSLRGMWLRAPRHVAGKGVVVFCHEFGSDMHTCARYARPLIETGFDVFTFDFRAHGDSSRPNGYRPLQWPSDKELEDVLGACAYVEEVLTEAGRPARLGIFGISRGAGAAILAASSDPNIACMVCDGAFSTAETLIALMKRWAHIFARVKLVYENHPGWFWRFLLWCMMRFAQPKLSRRFPSVHRALETMVPRPIMFIHGGRDSYVRPDQTRLLHAAAAGPKYLWVVPRAKHNQSVAVQPGQYAARTVAFYQKYLAGEAVSEEEIACPDSQTDVA